MPSVSMSYSYSYSKSKKSTQSGSYSKNSKSDKSSDESDSVSMSYSYSYSKSKKSTKSGSYSKKSKSGKSSEESDECIVCSNEPSKSMLMKEFAGKGSSSCEHNDKTLEAKCNKHEIWIKKKFCQLSCYLAGEGYEGDNCCTDEEEEY